MVLLILVALMAVLPGCNNKTEQFSDTRPKVFDVMADTWVATDGLGRTVYSGDIDREEKDRFVGLFYWTWHTRHSQFVDVPVNVNEVVSENPDASHDLNDPAWGTFTMPHHWDEPLYGYYDTDDRWVLRRHAELLAAAGVDVIIFDNTNGTFTWKDSYDVLFEVFAEARADGVNTPQIAFLLPFNSGDNTYQQLHALYEDIYSQGRYSDLWFYWKGKPLIMAYPQGLKKTIKEDREIYDFFTFRPGIPQYNVSDEDVKSDIWSKLFDDNVYWNWLSVYPQSVTYNADGSPEAMALSVAQNWSAELGLTAMNGENVFGRTYTSSGYDTSENAVAKGANFAEQAQRVLEIDPEFVFITGWNEWVAGRFEEWGGVINAFPDEYNDEFSRDIEPTKGELKDHYYYQMVDFIRQYKGTRVSKSVTSEYTVTTLDDWNAVDNIYYSYANNVFDRDDVGYGKIRYTDTTGRNDIVLAKVASDADNVYFLVECKEDISPQTDENWMRLLLSVSGDGDGWEGYDYIVNRTSPVGNECTLERSDGGWNWSYCDSVQMTLTGSKLSLKIPKASLGIVDNTFTIDFKWTDNTLSEGDIMDLYLYGDTAPTGRFNYRYSFGG